MSISEAMTAITKTWVAKEEYVPEESVLDVEEQDSNLRPTKLSYIEIRESTVKPSDFDVTKKLGYIDEKNGVCFDGNETTPQPKDDEIIVFKSFSEVGFGCQCSK